mgnify:CR=1 FL=1
MYDYLIVGAGLFGSVFARQATDAGKKVLVIDARTLQVMFIRRILRISMCTNMVRTFSIQIIKKCGIMLRVLWSSIVLRTVR